MLSTVIKKCVARILLGISANGVASSSDQPPRFFTVPVLGLHLPQEHIDVDTFPEDLRAGCSQIADDDMYTGQVWIFGRAKDTTSTYYVLAGLFKRRNADPARERRLYESWDGGVVFTLNGGTCGHCSEPSLQKFEQDVDVAEAP